MEIRLAAHVPASSVHFDPERGGRRFDRPSMSGTKSGCFSYPRAAKRESVYASSQSHQFDWKKVPRRLNSSSVSPAESPREEVSRQAVSLKGGVSKPHCIRAFAWRPH
jgi:hypothetical protein